MTDLAELDPGTPAAPPTKGERTRARLIEIAIARFGSHGFRRTSVSEIARAAGLTQAAAYAYFANKEELFLAAVDADAGALLSEASRAAEGTPSRNVVPALIIHLFTTLDEHPVVRRVLAGNEPGAIARLVDMPALTQFSAHIAEHLCDGQLDGEVRTDIDPVVMAAGIESLVLGLLFSTVQSGGLASPRHQEGVVAAFDAMLRPPS